jgi:hypothetical protein
LDTGELVGILKATVVTATDEGNNALFRYEDHIRNSLQFMRSFVGGKMYVPFLRHLFQFAQLHPIDMGICLSAGIVSIMWFEVLKIIVSGPEIGMLSPRRGYSVFCHKFRELRHRVDRQPLIWLTGKGKWVNINFNEMGSRQ